MQIYQSQSAVVNHNDRPQAVKNNQDNDLEVESSTSQPPFSTTLKNSQNLTYMLSKNHISTVSEEDRAFLSQDIGTLSLGLGDLERHYQSYGQQQDVVALIKVEGQVMAYMRRDGSVAGRNGVEDLFQQFSGDVQQLKVLVQQKFAGKGELEVFEQGQGPKNSTIFEMFNGKSYEVFSREQIAMRKDAQHAQQLAQEQNSRRQVMFHNEPQTAVFYVAGEVVGSMDEHGFADVGQALIDMADRRGIARSELGDLFTLDLNRSPNEYKNMLQEVLGEDVQLERFSVDAAPTRSEVRSMSDSD
ncbi:hypothetical protein ACSLBF_03630 [Pseudoalteromonas sp. T1lg65]|uniref:hypothetical protein n=1 Tax=Pseudoalteromonas sp. T1lg65 TaxID=2077101 RepID=UPI003F7A2BD8